MAYNLTDYISDVCIRVTGILTARKDPLWSETEEILTDAHLLFIQPFLVGNVPQAEARALTAIWESILLDAPKFTFINEIKLCAINWRGLYLENGRRTRMAPSKTLTRRGQNSRWHEILHQEYLEFAGRHVSINQIFLEWDINKKAINGKDDLRQELLSITYDEETESSIEVNKQRDVRISLSTKLTKQLLPLEIPRKIIQHHKAKNRRHGDLNLFKKLRENVDSQVENTIRFALTHESNFFEQFRQVFASQVYTKDAITRFQELITSLSWLRFYCNRHFAGSSFYTIRLPNILAEVTGYPDSSITIVSKKKLPEIEHNLRTLVKTLRNNKEYVLMKTEVGSLFDEWVKSREEAPNETDLDKFLWDITKRDDTHSSIPIDFRKLAFMCRLASHLERTRHEGQHLRFAFLLGFTHDQIVGQLEGAVEQYGTKLEWPDMLNPEKHKEVAKWIEANALILQRWDLVLFFETFKEYQDHPTGKRLLRIKKLEPSVSASGNHKWSGYPTNEFELRKSLVQITSEQKGTSALLISERGSTLILRGKLYLFRYEGDKGEGRFMPYMSGDKTFVEKFEGRLVQQLHQLESNRISNLRKKGAGQLAGNRISEIWKKRARQLRELAEALVTMGHGALIAIRISAETNPTLPPLAPVWKLRETQTVADLSDDITTFALACALDGATEIIFHPDGDSDGQVVFRRYANEKFEPWEEVNGEVIQNLKFKESPIDWSEMMTFGTRHRSAVALSLREAPDEVLVLSVSADGPVRLWSKGEQVDDVVRFKP